ncbi:MAG: hypothetical protein ABI672_07725 [Vicinamibacteria bacterium]
MSPQTRYVRVINNLRTTAADTKIDLSDPVERFDLDGSVTITLSGSYPAGQASRLYAYPVPVPSRFAEFAFMDALRANGVAIKVTKARFRPNRKRQERSTRRREPSRWAIP